MSARQLTEPRLVIATHNAGKLKEFRELLAPFGIDITSAGALGLPEPEETGTTYLENARLKALAAARASGLPALADDSGLAVWGLHGAPGLFSARWAGATKDFGAAMQRVWKSLETSGAILRDDGTTARFVAALVLAWPDGHVEEVEGVVDGRVVWPPRGDQGFGYDPMFQPQGHTRTFGEIGAAEKHGVDWAHPAGLSHRARAFVALAQRCLWGRRA